MKVYVHYEEGSDAENHVTLKLTLPKKWNDESPAKLLELFIDSYNKRKPNNQLDSAEYHLEVGDGKALARKDTIGATITERADVHVRSGKTAEGGGPILDPAATVASVEITKGEGALRCRNFGCTQRFDEDNNSDTACRFHTAPPIFHDTRKGWGCCKKRVYDWDEFEKLEGCQVGRHSTADPKDRLPKGPSPEVREAPKPVPVLKSIDNFNAENPKAATAAGSVAATITAKKKSTRREDGTASCVNLGCQKDFKVSENNPSSCRYHAKNPIFHDGGKHWACCPSQVKYEFEDFIVIPGCCIGYHDDGSEEFKNPPGVA